jgi:hypothetical protein
MEGKIECPDFNKMTYSEIINWIDQEAERKLRNGVVINDKEIRNLKLMIPIEKLSNLLEKHTERINNLDERTVKIEEAIVKITELIKEIIEHSIKNKYENKIILK